MAKLFVNRIWNRFSHIPSPTIYRYHYGFVCVCVSVCGFSIVQFQIAERLSYQRSTFSLNPPWTKVKRHSMNYYHCYMYDSSNAKCVECWNDNNRSLKCEIKCWHRSVTAMMRNETRTEKQCIFIDSFGCCLEFQSKSSIKTDTMWCLNGIHIFWLYLQICQLILKLKTHISLFISYQQNDPNSMEIRFGPSVVFIRMNGEWNAMYW